MTFKEFKDWCYQRACDGCWGMDTAVRCIAIHDIITKESRWKRKQEKIWKERFEKDVVENIINPIEEKIKEVYGEVK